MAECLLSLSLLTTYIVFSSKQESIIQAILFRLVLLPLWLLTAAVMLRFHSLVVGKVMNFFPSCSPSPTRASPVVFCIDIYIFLQFCPHSLRIITSHVHIIIHFLHNYDSDLPFRGKYHSTVIPQEETAR